MQELHELNMNLDWDASATTVSNVFIDKYMPGANPTYSVIYLFLLRHTSANKKITFKEAAEKLELLESDIVKALRYWEKAGLLRLGKTGGDFEITFLRCVSNVHSVNGVYNESDLFVPASPAEDLQKREEQPKPRVKADMPSKSVTRIHASRPQYTSEELEVYKSDCQDIDRLFSVAEDTLGKMLNFNDLSVIFGLYDWLRLPVDVIEKLLRYCADNGHRSIRYIEKAAIDWAENGINTVEKSTAYIEIYNRDYREILKAFGQSRREPSQAEIAIMKKWINEYKMPIDVVIAACDKTIMAIGHPKFAYADSIIESWHTNGIRTLDAVNEAQDRYYKDKIEAVRAKKDNKDSKGSRDSKEGKPARTNRFINFKQRQWDYDELEKLEREYIENSLTVQAVSKA